MITKGFMNISKEDLETAVKNATNIEGVFANLGLKPRDGKRYREVKDVIKFLEISTDHFSVRPKIRRDYSLDDLSDGSRVDPYHLRNFLSFHSVKRECKCCKIDSWLESPLVLQIDHIDGNPANNKLENLQYLCPNCHSQKTALAYAEKKAKTLSIVNYCVCGEIIDRTSKKCRVCASLKPGVIWPEREELYEQVWSLGLKSVGASLGVSGETVSRYCKVNNIPTPLIGTCYWHHMRHGRLEECVMIKAENPLPPL